jgi:hypothetical protein
MKLHKTKRNKTDHFQVAIAFINYLHQNDVAFTLSELTPTLFRFMADKGYPCSQPTVSKTLFYVKNYITVKVAKSLFVKESEVSE